MSDRQKNDQDRSKGDDEDIRGDERVRDITVSSYGSSQNDQTRTRERVGNNLDEAGEPTLAEAEELRRAERHED